MPSSTTEIANRALTKLGDERILSLTEETKQARTLNSMFAQVRDAELRRNRWNFAMTRAALPALSTPPAWGYAFAFTLPADFLSLVQVGAVYVRTGSRDRKPWSVESGAILTDMAAPLVIRYVRRVENSGLFDPLFVETLACRLAFEACEALTQSSTKKQAASEEYKAALSEAARCNAFENPPDEFPRGSWLDSREGADFDGIGDAVAGGQFPSGFTVI